MSFIINQVREYLLVNTVIRGFYGSKLDEMLKERFDISLSESVDTCTTLEKEGFLQLQYEVVCPKCGRTVVILDSLDNIEYVDNCQYCGMMQDGFGMHDTRIYYKTNR